MKLALLVALVMGQAEEEARLSGLEVMPRSALACVRLRSASATVERLKQTALADILAEEEVQAALGELLDMARNAPRRMEAVGGMSREDLLKAFGGEMTVAVAGFEGNAPKACLALDVSERRAELEKVLAVARIVLALAGGRQYIHRGYTIDTITVPDQKMELCFTFVKNLFLFATGPAEIEAMIARALGEGEGEGERLSSRDEFVRVREKLGDPDVLVFVPVHDLLARFAPMIPGEAMRALRLLGLGEVLAFAASLEVSGKEFVEKACILASQGARALRVFEGGETTLPALGQVPFEAFAYAAARLSPGELFSCLKDLAAGAGRGPRAERELERLRGLLGRDVAQFVELFSGELQLHAARPPGAGLVPDVVLTAELERADEVAASLETLVAALEGGERPRLSRCGYGGVRFYAVHGGRKRPISVCFGVVDEFAVLTLGSQAMKRAIASFDLPGPALSENPRFGEAVEDLARGRAGLSYVDLPELVSFAYSTLAPFADNAPQLGDIPMRGLDLPLPEVITAHLSPIVAVVRPEGDLVLVEVHSPLPVSVPVAVGALGAAAERRKARRRAAGPPPPAEEFEEGEDVF